jgi:hypothetical protein
MAHSFEEHEDDDPVSLPLSAIVTDDEGEDQIDSDDDYTVLPASAIVDDDEGAIRIKRKKPPTRPTRCPRCDTKLTNPEGLGWCSECGYCHSLEEEGKTLPDPDEKPETAAKPSPLGVMEFGQLMQKLPSWVWIMIAGLVTVIGLSIAANMLLPDVCLARALWSALQMVLGFCGLVGVQLWAVLRYGSEDDKLGAKDIVLPGGVWRVVIRRLPASRGALWVGTWCLTAIICGAFIIGGYDYWLELLKEGKFRRMAAALDRSSEVVASNKEDTAKEIEIPPGQQPERQGAVQSLCVVIGYQTDLSGNLTSLIVATSAGNNLRYAGIVSEGLTSRQSKELLRSLSKLTRAEPLIPGLSIRGVQWVKPGVFCDVSHIGLDQKGQFKEPKLKEVRD